MAVSRGARGFTIPELMITMAILGIIAAVAYPSFIDSIRKGRRSEAISALALVQQGEERFRSSNATYGDSSNFGTWGVTTTTASGYYTMTVSGVSATGYTATATASGGTQTGDTNCTVIGVQMVGGNLSYGGGSGSISWGASPDPNRCWSR